jgi:putative addiction module component (TIGR02574 family)
MPTAKQLCDQALQLPPEERMALVDQILDTLDERDSSLDAQWALEAESRLAAYRRGEVQAIPLGHCQIPSQNTMNVRLLPVAVVCADSHTA